MIAGSMRPIWSVCISDSSSSVEQKQKQYDRELERAIVERTKSYKEWEYEIDQAKRNIFKKYVSKMDETHPFMVDDYRMEVAKEMHRIDSFYEPIIQREADVLRAKRARGLVSLLSQTILPSPIRSDQERCPLRLLILQKNPSAV